MREFLSMQEVAAMLGVSVKTVSRMILAGKLPATRVGGVYRIRLADVDDYVEKGRVVGRETDIETETKREAEVRPGAEPRTCARCLRLLKGISPVGGQCQSSGCEALLCRACWANEQDRYCRDHTLPKDQRLADARQRLQRGEIPLLVTVEEARERELKFISRFDIKIREKPYLVSPVDGTQHPITSWGLAHSESSELEAGKLISLRWQETGAVVPRNLSSTYSWPPPGSGRAALLGGRFVIAALAFADLTEFISQGFSVTPASRTRLWQFLEERVAAAKAAETFHLLGLASPTGWTPEAEVVVIGGPQSRSFTSLFLSLCLVDLHRDRVIYNPLDKRLLPFIPLFRGELDVESVTRIYNYIKKELQSGTSSLTIKEIIEGTGADMALVREALVLLESEGGYKMDNLPEYGLVVTREM